MLKVDSDDYFSVLLHARSHIHLEVLKSVYIHVQRSVLCAQKQFVKPLHLFHSYCTRITLTSCAEKRFCDKKSCVFLLSSGIDASPTPHRIFNVNIKYNYILSC